MSLGAIAVDFEQVELALKLAERNSRNSKPASLIARVKAHFSAMVVSPGSEFSVAVSRIERRPVLLRVLHILLPRHWRFLGAGLPLTNCLVFGVHLNLDIKRQPTPITSSTAVCCF